MRDNTPQLPLFTTAPHNPMLEIPYGYCHCGCGQKTSLAQQSDTKRGLVKGQPTRFIQFHGIRVRHAPLIVRFWSKVAKRGEDECWEWQGGRNQDGYGTLTSGTTPTNSHRISWELHYGPIPSGISVLHRCDNPPCCNPNHLFLGTQIDNMQDMVAKGRARNGRQEPKS